MAIDTNANGTIGNVDDGRIGTESCARGVVPSLSELGMDDDAEDAIVGAVALALSAVGLVAVGVLIGKAASALRR